MIPCIDLENFVFKIIGNCRRQLSFDVVFPVNDSKYQNILPTPTFANSLCCALLGQNSRNLTIGMLERSDFPFFT